jgi:prefoldin alpha subunit
MEAEEKRGYIQNLAVEADAHQRRGQELQNQMQSLQMAETEMKKTEEALKNLKEKGTALFSLGSGVFVGGEIKNANKILVNVGSEVLVEMGVASTLKFITERGKEIGTAKEELLKAMQAISNRLREIDMEARQIMGHEHSEK